MDITVPSNFTPRDYQLPVLRAMSNGIKRAVMVWHRRAGKDMTCLGFVASQMMQRVGNYYYFFPTYNQGKKVIWEGKKRDGTPMLDIFPDEIIQDKNKSELQIVLKNNSLFQIVGTDNFDSIMGTGPVGCVFSEYSLQNPQAWDLIRPILNENDGWALFPFTPRGENHGYDLYEMAKNNPRWFAQLATVDDTKAVTPEEIEEERQAGMSEAMIQQEYYCDFSGMIPGAYYSALMNVAKKENRIGRLPWEPKLPVDTFWDLGVGDSTAIWFVQQHNQEVRIIDYYEASGVGFIYYVKVLSEKPYVFGTHNAPFDIEVKELGTGKSRLETAESLGLRFEVVPKLGLEDGIDAVRNLIPRCWFDEEKCKQGIRALRNYYSKFDPTKRIFNKSPVHDWSSHGADAFRYLAVGLKPKQEEYRPARAPTPNIFAQRKRITRQRGLHA